MLCSWSHFNSSDIGHQGSEYGRGEEMAISVGRKIDRQSGRKQS